LAGASIAVGFSVLLWYLRHFIDTLQEAEKESPGARQSLAKSPRIVGVFAGVLFVLSATVLCSVVLFQASNAGVVSLPLTGAGLCLLLLCICSPALGAVLVALVAVYQVGWRHGVFEAMKNLIPALPAAPIDLHGKVGVLSQALTATPEDALLTEDSTLANWEVSLRWVRTNEARWGLGRGFVKLNQDVLVSLVAGCLRREPNRNCPECFEQLEQSVAEVLNATLSQLGVLNAVLLNRPIQLARAACALYATEFPAGKQLETVHGRS
jgi:uncharacterized membrane protein